MSVAGLIEILHPLKDPAVELVDAHGVVAGVLTPEVVHAGWHVNVYAEVVDARPGLDGYIITPSRLRREFYGREADTVALKFPDEATARAALGLD